MMRTVASVDSEFVDLFHFLQSLNSVPGTQVRLQF